MTPIKRTLAAVSVPVLLALSLSACGGGDSSSAPKDTSQADFCAAATLPDLGSDSDDVDAAVSAAHDYADKLADVGTPSDMSDSERSGFEAFTNKLKDISSDDVDDFANASDASDVFGDEAGDVTAYLTYLGTECPDALTGGVDASDLPSLDPSDLPSIDPSDLGSIDPSDLASLLPSGLPS